MHKDNIFIASDHAGFHLKEYIISNLKSEYNIIINDLGTYSDQSVDYPDYAKLLTDKMLKTPNSYGILVCATGIGMSITANRSKHIRAALCFNDFMAKQARLHNDANVLVIGSKVIKQNREVIKMILTFLNSEFESGRHKRRVDKIDSSGSEGGT